MQRIVERDLFSISVKAIEVDITKDIDFLAHEKPFLNKCLGFESRKAAYDLLTTISSVHPDLVGDLITNYWHPLV